MEWVKETSLAIKRNEKNINVPYDKVEELYAMLDTVESPLLEDNIKTIIFHIGFLMGMKLKSKYNSYRLNSDDIRQISAIGTGNALKSYDKNLKVKITSHMYNCIKYALLDSQYSSGQVKYSKGTSLKIAALSKAVGEIEANNKKVTVTNIIRFSDLETIDEAKKLYYIYLLEHKKEEMKKNDYFQISPEEEYEKKEENMELYGALNTLDELDRKIVTLKYVHEKTYQEIADMLGIGKSTAARRSRAALLDLRKKLD